jgi:hypothetical protein
MRRFIALLAGVAAVFVVVARPVVAAPNAPANATPAASVPPDAVGLSLSQIAGSGLAVTLDPGASEEHDLVISNHTANLRLTIKLSATDATGNLGAGAASWLAFGDDEIQLDPHVATTVPMTVAVPHDTQPGSALAHVTAAVETAVAAADGSPVAGTASVTFPVAMTVSGTPTAQIAIADVHRDDQGSRHELAIVVRNFGDQGAKVTGHVRVAGDHPQTLPFDADLAASSDTTVELKWNAPPKGTASDIAVDLEYGGGNVASWSSELGGAPTDLSPSSHASTPTTIATAAPASVADTTTTGAQASKPWWKQSFVTVLVILLLLAAGLWFGFEMMASRRRRDPAHSGPGPVLMPPGWAPTPSAESIDLAQQLVRLTDIVVQLLAVHRDEQELSTERARAPSAGLARAGPAPPDPGPPPEAVIPNGDEPEPDRTEVAHPAPMTSGAVARLEPVAVADEAGASVGTGVDEPVAAQVDQPLEDEVDQPFAHEVDAPLANEVAQEVDDPLAPMLARLVDLDRRRRRLRDWMDAEESGEAIEPSPDWYAFSSELDADGDQAAPGDGS